MGVGVGIVLLVVGAIIFFALQVDIPFFENETLGVILMVVGVLAIIIALVLNQQRSRTTHVERRYNDRPPPP